MRDGEPNIYAGICASRNTTMQLQWSGMQAYLAFNAVALPLAFGGSQSEFVKFVVSVFGFFMHTGLNFSVWYSTALLKFWDDKLADLENQDQFDSKEGSRVAVFSHPDFWNHQEAPRLRAYYIPFTLGMLVWYIEIVAHFVMWKG